MAAMAEAAAAFDRDDYLRAARDNAEFLLGNMVRDSRLRRTDGDSANGAQGFLDDYSHLIDGLLALHSADGDLRWLVEAEKLTRQAVALFWDPLQNRFYDTGGDQESLIIRPRDVTDNALPSGHSMMTGVLIRLSIITGDGDLRTMASDSLRGVRDIMLQFPTGAGHWLSVAGFLPLRPQRGRHNDRSRWPRSRRDAPSSRLLISDKRGRRGRSRERRGRRRMARLPGPRGH